MVEIPGGVFRMGSAAADAFVEDGEGPIRPVELSPFKIWEWCSDRWGTNMGSPAASQMRVNPAGPLAGEAKVIRGGSYLCHASYCNRYRCSARSNAGPDTSTGHLGFRCAVTRPT